NGQYLFSGDKGDTEPFQADATGKVDYKGNTGQRLIQVAQTRQMASADHGVDIFQRAVPGAQTYVAQAGGENTGAGTFGRVEVSDKTASGFGADIIITFEATTSGELEYVITNTAQSPVELQRGPYVAGDKLQINGISVTMEGEPQAGDTFDLRFAGNLQGSDFDVFSTLDDLIHALEHSSQGDSASMAALSNALAPANRKVNLHLDNALTVRASVGARLNELGALNDEGANRDLGYKKQLSGLEDLDYYAASANIAMQSMALQAAQMAYMKTQNLNLFSLK